MTTPTAAPSVGVNQPTKIPPRMSPMVAIEGPRTHKEAHRSRHGTAGTGGASDGLRPADDDYVGEHENQGQQPRNPRPLRTCG